MMTPPGMIAAVTYDQPWSQHIWPVAAAQDGTNKQAAEEATGFLNDSRASRSATTPTSLCGPEERLEAGGVSGQGGRGHKRQRTGTRFAR